MNKEFCSEMNRNCLIRAVLNAETNPDYKRLEQSECPDCRAQAQNDQALNKKSGEIFGKRSKSDAA